METEALEDSQVRADRVKTIAVDSRDLTKAAQIAASPTLDGFRNTSTIINEDVNAANMEQHHALSKTLVSQNAEVLLMDHVTGQRD